MGEKIRYRKLSGYKYELAENYFIVLPFECPAFASDFFNVSGNLLSIKRGYAWDGPSGPAIDSKNFLRASLCHDVIYQSIRGGFLPPDPFRERADNLMRQLCLEDGMSRVRAWWTWRAVRDFAGGATAIDGKPEESETILEAP